MCGLSQGNMPAKFEVRSFNRVGIISTYFPKNRGHVTLATPLFQEFFRGHVQTVPGNMPAKFEVCSFECIDSRQRNQLHCKIDGNKFAQPPSVLIKEVYGIGLNMWQTQTDKCTEHHKF